SSVLRATIVGIDLSKKPCSRVSPPALGCWFRNSKNLGCFFNLQTAEITELHQFGFSFVAKSESFHRFIDCEQFVITCGGDDFHVLNVEPLLSAAVTQCLITARVLYENTPHGFRRRTEEMRATIPLHIFVSCEPQPSLVHQRRRLQRLAGSFVRHFIGCEPAEFFIDEWKQFIGGIGIAFADSIENAREVAHLVTAVFWVSVSRSEEHTSELQSLRHLVCRLLLEK